MKIGIIGGGFAGCASAHLISKIKGAQVDLFEASSELGAGNRTNWWAGHPYTFGPRHFLTEFEHAYEYLNEILPLRSHSKHEFKTFVEADDAFYNYPINMQDVRTMPDYEKIRGEMNSLKGSNEDAINSSKNLKDYWLASVGETLFKKFVNEYNKKMWLVDDCEKIDTFSWSPKGVSIKDGNRAAWDTVISAYPYAADGYNSYFDIATKDINVFLNTRVEKVFVEDKKILVNDETVSYDIVVSTVSPDLLFGCDLGKLGFIGRDLLKIVLPMERVLPDDIYFLYYANEEPFTRIVEYKKFTAHESKNSLIGLEIPSMNGRHYPLPLKKDIDLSDKYFGRMPKGFYSIGRMGSYRYDVDIDDSIVQAMMIAEDIKTGSFSGPVPAMDIKRL